MCMVTALQTILWTMQWPYWSVVNVINIFLILFFMLLLISVLVFSLLSAILATHFIEFAILPILSHKSVLVPQGHRCIGNLDNANQTLTIR